MATQTENLDKAYEDKYLEELDLPKSYEELKAIILKITDENPISDTLFLEKYQILLLEDFLFWQKPLGELYKKAIAICIAKTRKKSEPSTLRNEVFSEDAGCPLSTQFSGISLRKSVRSRTQSLVRALSEEFHLIPLSQTIGKKLLSLCNVIGKESPQNVPFIAICHDKNTKSFVLLGSFPKDNSTLIIENKGSVSKQELLPRLSTLKETHLEGFPSSFSTINTLVYAKYDFLSSADKKSALNPIKDDNAFVECWWSNAFALLEPMESTTCTSFAKITAVEGNANSGATSFYEEIQFIEALQKGLLNGVIKWSGSTTDKGIMKRLKDFLNAEKNNVTKKEKPSPPTPNLKYFDHVVLRTRTNLDFTEKLWFILKESSSCQELQDAFCFVYKALESFPTPPYVYQKNMSTIALSVKKMMEESVICPVLSHKSAIELLLEIGVAKVRRDYATVFFSLELIPFESMSYFLQPDLASLEAVTCLKKLHTVLELAIVCVKRLKFTLTLLQEFVRSTLRHYTTVPDVDLSHVFTFRIPAKNARQLLLQMRPTVWEISFVSSTNNFMKQSCHQYITTPIHDHIYAPENYHPTLMLKTASYVYSTATLVRDDMFQEGN